MLLTFLYFLQLRPVVPTFIHSFLCMVCRRIQIISNPRKVKSINQSTLHEIDSLRIMRSNVRIEPLLQHDEPLFFVVVRWDDVRILLREIAPKLSLRPQIWMHVDQSLDQVRPEPLGPLEA